ncbi:hypothetical protein PIB30_091522 [Stylosanthes scabra]|uniref:Retrotransposon gag domain-containing protein n=1 Tax=Stylosanthes scabra TaxID=79078 RepID=A0ABU6UU25_9FABA|nr:hypothetical protein [Stylosanthes scabra]
MEKSDNTKNNNKPTYNSNNTRRGHHQGDSTFQQLIKPPSKARTCQDQLFMDRAKYCTFHQKFGHTTDECVMAKDLLERLAREGRLDKYVVGKVQRSNATPQLEESSQGGNQKDKGKKANLGNTSATSRNHKLHFWRVC